MLRVRGVTNNFFWLNPLNPHLWNFLMNTVTNIPTVSMDPIDLCQIQHHNICLIFPLYWKMATSHKKVYHFGGWHWLDLREKNVLKGQPITNDVMNNSVPLHRNISVLRNGLTIRITCTIYQVLFISLFSST